MRSKQDLKHGAGGFAKLQHRPSRILRLFVELTHDRLEWQGIARDRRHELKCRKLHVHARVSLCLCV